MTAVSALEKINNPSKQEKIHQEKKLRLLQNSHF